ncbi:MAG: peptidylprolyl isomerase [Gammaproteobacteria bacterium]|nr:peptidylprolyl isomerase [Gammaproteobacteria bacterium]
MNWIALCGACLALHSLSTSAEEEVLDAVAVIVNDDVVTMSEIEERYQTFLQQATEAGVTDLPAKKLVMDQIVERLISERIQLQEAAMRGIVASDEEITDAIRDFAAQNEMSLDEYRELLEAQGMTYREFREGVHRQLVLQTIQQYATRERIWISNQDVKDFRNSPFFERMATDQYQVGHILISTDSSDVDSARSAEAEAREVVDQLREGADFATMAINHSSASTALEGGNLGWRFVEQIPSLFAEVVIEMQVGETADPIRNALGFHIIQLLDKRGASNTKAQQSLVRHILIRPSMIKSSEEAYEEISALHDELTDGADFAELAKEHSEDPLTALAGGEVGWTDGTGLPPAVVEKINETGTGELSDVFETQDGWHVLEVVDRRIADLSEKALDDMALNALYQRSFEEALLDWLKQVRDEAFVKVIREVN